MILDPMIYLMIILFVNSILSKYYPTYLLSFYYVNIIASFYFILKYWLVYLYLSSYLIGLYDSNYSLETDYLHFQFDKGCLFEKFHLIFNLDGFMKWVNHHFIISSN